MTVLDGNRGGVGIGLPLTPRPDFGIGMHDLMCNVCERGWVGREREVCAACLDRWEIDPTDRESIEAEIAQPDETTERSRAEVQRPKLTRLADVETEPIDWLWHGRLPFGKIVVLDGDPGLAKSVMTVDWAARLSTGRTFPGQYQTVTAADVVIMTAEDGIADTVRPRLDAAGGDIHRVHCFEGVETGKYDIDGQPVYQLPKLPSDTAVVEQVIADTGARLLIIDVLAAYVEKGYNLNSDQDMRAVLTPLSKVAERTGCCIVVLRHLNKSQGLSAIYRGGGSVGIGGAARVTLIVGVHPEDKDEDSTTARKVLAVGKVNIARHAPALEYRTVERDSTVVIEWGGATTLSADDLVSAEGSVNDDDDPDAADFLITVLRDGPLPVKAVQAEGTQAGFSKDQLKRAKKRLHIRSDKEDGVLNGPWFWTLPDKKRAP